MKSYREYVERRRIRVNAKVSWNVQEPERTEEMEAIKNRGNIEIKDLGSLIEIDGSRDDIHNFLVNDRNLDLTRDEIERFILKELEKQYAPEIKKAKSQALRSKMNSKRIRPGVYRVEFKSYDSKGKICNVEVFIERNHSTNKDSRWEWSGDFIMEDGGISHQNMGYTEPEPSKRDIMDQLKRIQSGGLAVIGLGEIVVRL